MCRPIGGAAARSARHGAAYSLGMSLYCLTYAHLACLNSVKSVIVRAVRTSSRELRHVMAWGRFASGVSDDDRWCGRYRPSIGGGDYLDLLLM